MADLTTLSRSPLSDRVLPTRVGAGGDRQVQLLEWQFLTMVSLRVNPQSTAAAALEEVLGTGLPRSCGQVASHGAHSVLWLGPDEWLVVSRTASDTLVHQLMDAVRDVHASVVDVSANRTLLELSGPAARAVLEKGCPLDLHSRAFRADMAVNTTLARVPLLLWQAGPATYRLLPRSSFADYVARWLEDAMQEFGTDSRDVGAP